MKRILLMAGLLAIVYITLTGAVWLWQAHLLFFPADRISATPAKFGLRYEEVWLSVPDRPSDRIHGWWIPAAGSASRTGTLLYLHGNGGNIGSVVEHANCFHRLGLSVLLIDYRSYGQSRGRFPSETQVYQDAQIAWNYLTQTRQIPPQQIFLFGHSLGGAIAIDLAVRQPDAAGLIVESTFTSIRDVVKGIHRYRLFPMPLLTQRFDSIAKVPFLQMPILLIHGTADEQIPAAMSETLYAVAPAPKQLWLVPNADHNHVFSLAETEYLQTVQQFLDRAKLYNALPR